MTEKRYGLEMDKNCYKCIADTVDGKLYTDEKQVVNLLNELAEENKELKGKASSWKMTASEEVSEKQGLIKQIVELKKENEQLRKKLIYLIENGLKELFGEEYRIIEDIGDFE